MSYESILNNDFSEQMYRPGLMRKFAEFFVSGMTYFGATSIGALTPGYLPLEQPRVSVVRNENEDLDRLAA